MSAVARGELEGSVESSRGALGERDARVGWMRCDEVDNGVEPDVAIHGVLGAGEPVDEGDERGADVGAAAGENRVALAMIGARNPDLLTYPAAEVSGFGAATA